MSSDERDASVLDAAKRAGLIPASAPVTDPLQDDGSAFVHVWYVHTDSAADPLALAEWSRLLSRDERERAASFVFDKDRAGYVAAHALLRLTLSRFAAVPPERWCFRAGEHGRPEIVGEGEELGLRFSLSHTAGIALCAVSRYAALGVDVEASARRPSLQIAESYFAPAERAALAALPLDQRPQRFLEYWTLKESFLKALGVGLSYPLNRISFELAPDGPIRVSCPAELEASPEAWQFECWQLGDGYRAALAVRSGASRRRLSVHRAGASGGERGTSTV